MKYETMTKIPYIINNENNICIFLYDYSIAELNKCNYSRNKIEKNYNIVIKNDLFWFARISVLKQRQNRGSGTFLMNELIKIVDKRKIDIVNALNPYEIEDATKLIKFYKKFGFEFLNKEKDFMYRKGE